MNRFRLLCRTRLAIIGSYHPQQEPVATDTGKLFSSGRCQAVRLPKQYRFEGDSVLIKRVGRAVVLLPRSATWDCLGEALERFEPGLRLVRRQPVRAERRSALRP